MSKIYLVDNNRNRIIYNDHWRRFLKTELERLGYEVKLITGWNANYKTTPLGDLYDECAYGEDVARVFTQRRFNDGDVFIFMDARSFIPIRLREHVELFDKDIMIIGFWVDGVYNNRGHVRTGRVKHDRIWATNFERSIAHSIDYNLVTNETQLKYFNRYIKKDDKKARYCPLPMIRPDETDLWTEEYSYYPRENLVLVEDNYNPGDQDMKDELFDIIQEDMPEFQFVRLDEKTYTYGQHYKTLSRAKAMFGLNTFERDPYVYVEAMKFGVTPYVPNTELYEELFDGDDRYVFDLSIIGKRQYINFIRRRGEMYDGLRKIMNDPNSEKKSVEDFDRIYDDHYNVEHFLKFIDTHV